MTDKRFWLTTQHGTIRRLPWKVEDTFRQIIRHHDLGWYVSFDAENGWAEARHQFRSPSNSGVRIWRIEIDEEYGLVFFTAEYNTTLDCGITAEGIRFA